MTHDDWMFMWTHYWWLIFPMAWFLYAFYCSSLRYQHRRDKLELLKTYAQQGKDVPAELAKALGNGNGDDWRWGRHYDYYGPYREQRRTIFLAAVAAGFAAAYYFNPEHNEAFGIVAVIVGVLALGWLLIWLTTPRSDGK